MNARSLRYRLVAWYALWLALVFVAAGVLLHLGLRRYLEISLGTAEMRRAERIALLAGSRPLAAGPELAAGITAGFAPEASGRFVRIAGPDGGLLYQSGIPADQSFDPGQIAPPVRTAGTRKETQRDGTELIIATYVNGGRFTVETGESLAPALAELRRLLVTLALAFTVFDDVALVVFCFAFG